MVDDQLPEQNTGIPVWNTDLECQYFTFISTYSTYNEKPGSSALKESKPPQKGPRKAHNFYIFDNIIVFTLASGFSEGRIPNLVDDKSRLFD